MNVVDFILNTILFILLFVLNVYIHEIIHFLAAKAMKLKVSKLNLGNNQPLLTFKLKNMDITFGRDPLSGSVIIDESREALIKKIEKLKAVLIAPVYYHATIIFLYIYFPSPSMKMMAIANLIILLFMFDKKEGDIVKFMQFSKKDYSAIK